MDKTLPILTAAPNHEETLHAIQEAMNLAETTPPDVAIPRLGQGWVAEEAVAISIYCALIARDFAQGNPRALMNIAGELLAVAAQREARHIDEKLFLEMCATPPLPEPKTARPRR